MSFILNVAILCSLYF